MIPQPDAKRIPAEADIVSSLFLIAPPASPFKYRAKTFPGDAALSPDIAIASNSRRIPLRWNLHSQGTFTCRYARGSGSTIPVKFRKTVGRRFKLKQLAD
jgi:hypothetical protein